MPVADGVRLALDVAGLDRVPLGIRDHGPLAWDPDAEVPFERVEPPVAVARRAVLARTRVERVEVQARCARWMRDHFGGDR